MVHVFLFGIILLTSFFIGAFCWTYSINEWLLYAGKETQIVWWQGGLIGLVPVLGQLSIPFAVGTWILLMFL